MELSIEQIKQIIATNFKERMPQYSGLSSSDIGRYSRSIMFGENDEAFPDQEEWSRIVD